MSKEIRTADVSPPAPAMSTGVGQSNSVDALGNQFQQDQLAEGAGGGPMEFRGGSSYVVQRGDTLSAISARTYGDPSRWRVIRDANPFDVFEDGRLIRVGAHLILPLQSVPAAPERIDERSGDLGDSIVGQVSLPDADVAEDVAVSCDPVDYEAFFDSLVLSDPGPRRAAMVRLRQDGGWEGFLDAIGDEEIAVIQSWMPAEEGLDGSYTLEERVAHARNSTRAADALTRVDIAAQSDTSDPPRITERVRELLALGVALPKFAASDLTQEGVLSAPQAERAATALILMPQREYARVLLTLASVGDESALEQSFLTLKAVAARHDQVTDADVGNDSLADIEQMADGIREADAETAIRMTQVTQFDAADTGLEQQFTMSCAPASGVVLRAESDPVEAYRTRVAGMAQTDLGGDLASETESALERHGLNQVAQARDTSDVTTTVNTAIGELGAALSVAEVTAVNAYMSGNAFVQANYDSGMVKIRDHVGSGASAQEMRLVRETAIGGNAPGMTANQIANEYNSDAGMNVDGVTGATYTADIDATLGAYRGTVPGGVFPAVMPVAITTQVSALLATAETRLSNGYDVGFGVMWSGGGGHAMSMLDVQGAGNTAEFLVHNTGSGTTQWVTVAQFQQANLPMGRGLIYRLARPD